MASNSDVSKSGDQLYIKKNEDINHQSSIMMILNNNQRIHRFCQDPTYGLPRPIDYRQTISKFEPSTGSSEYVNQRKSFGTPRAEAVAGNRIYLFGGAPDKAQILEMFDLSTHQWTILSSRPWKPITAQILALGDFVYVAYTGNSSLKPDFSVDRVQPNFFVRYSVSKDRWETLSPRQTNGYSFQLVELNGLLYHIADSFNNQQINEVEEYNPETDQWRSLASPNYCHNYDTDTVSFSGKIYIISPYGFEEYTPETDSWKGLEKLPAYRKGTLVVYNRKLWAVNRKSMDRETIWTMNEFDMSSGKWNSLPEVNCEPMKTDFQVSVFVCHSEK